MVETPDGFVVRMRYQVNPGEPYQEATHTFHTEDDKQSLSHVTIH